MPDDPNPLQRLRLIHKIVCDAVNIPAEELLGYVRRRCIGDAELEATVLRKIEAVRADQEIRELAVDLSLNYEILEQIGAGGMGVVFRAYQKTLQRDVAIKKIRVGTSPLDSSQRVSFLKEARVAAVVKHPAIIEVFEFGILGGDPCIAMELIEGMSLAERLAEKGRYQSTESAVEVVTKLAEAIAAAHSQGVIHRDLKPANVLLDAEGNPKISDFGIAKLLQDRTEQPNQSIAGTIGYMAPEQATGAPIGPSVDIFSLGAILFTLLTGRPPYEAESIEQYADQFSNTPPPSARATNTSVDRRLNSICKKCLEASPLARFQDAEELASRMRRWSAWRRRRLQIAITGAMMVCLAAIGGFFANRAANFEALETATSIANADLDFIAEINSAYDAWEHNDVELARSILKQFMPGSNRPDRRGIEWHWLWRQCNRETIVLNDYSGPIWSISLSPDGTLLASAGDAQSITVWDRQFQRKKFEFVTDSASVQAVAFSPDSKFLAWGSISGRGFHRTSAELVIRDLTQQTISAIVPIQHADIEEIKFSNDGKRIFVLANGLHVFGNDGIHIQTIQASGDAFGLSADNTLAAIANGDVNQPSDVSIIDIASGSEVRRLKGHEQTVSAIQFDETGQVVLTASRDGSIRKWNGSTGEQISFIDAGADVLDAVFLENSDSIAYSTIDNNVLIARTQRVDEFVLEPVRLQGHAAPAFDLEFDLNRRQLLSASKDGTIRIWDADNRTNPIFRPVFRSTIAPFRQLSVAPKGSLLGAIIGGHGGTAQLALWAVRDGCAHARRAPSLDGQPTDLAFFSSGQQVAVLCTTDNGDIISIVNTSTAKEIRRFNAGQGHDRLVCSPDDSMVAAAARNRTDVWTSDGLYRGELPTHSGTATDIAFSSDSRLLAVTCRSSTTVSVWNVTKQVREFELTEHADGIKSIAFSDDGKLIATGGAYGGVKLWDMEGNYLGALEKSNAFVDVAFLPDGRLLSCGMASSTISMWDADSLEVVDTWKSPIPELSELYCGEDGMFISSHGPSSLSLTLWHRNERLPLGTIKPGGLPFGEIKVMEFEANSKRLFVAGGTADAGRLVALSAESGEVVSKHDVHTALITDIATSHDGDWLATCSEDRSIKLLDGVSLSEVRTFSGHSAAVTSIAFSDRDELLISSGGHDSTVRIWDRRTGSELQRLFFRNWFIVSACIAQNKRTVLVARNRQESGVIEALNLDESEPVYVIKTPPITGLIMSPCGKYAGFCDGNAVCVFNVADGKTITTTKAATNTAAFSQNGNRFIFPNGQVQVFDTQTHKKVAAFVCASGRPEHVVISRDDSYFAAGLSNGHVTIWGTAR